MTEKPYTIENLIELFKLHAEEFDVITDDGTFNLPSALHLICKEIKELKEKKKIYAGTLPDHPPTIKSTQYPNG